MLIVQIVGGLGNQMFQYALARSLHEQGYEVKLDISAFESYKLHGGYQLLKYNISIPIATAEEINKLKINKLFVAFEKFLHIPFSKWIREKNFLFQKDLITSDNVYISGYFQTEKYFLEIRNILLEEFVLTQSISNYTNSMKESIEKTEQSVSLHVRRGDYINNPIALKTHGICSLEYYKTAINFLEKQYSNITFFLFSDDVDWVRENLSIKNSVVVASEEKRLPHEDIYLMSLCRHNIIANSSFSWWGAWLNQNTSKIVVAPQRWFADEQLHEQSKDIICKNWIKI